MTLRQWILKMHFYGGLLCFWYLVIFSISSLHFHHHFEFMNETQISEELPPMHLRLDNSKSDSALATTIQNTLDIAGWYLPWETRRDSSGVFHTQIQNPKAGYLIQYDPVSSTIRVTKEDKGFWSVFNALHGFSGAMPNAPFLIFWNLFTYLCLLMVLFSIFSGIWLWASGKRDQFIGWVTVVGTMSLSILLMVYVYLNG